jgi:hypothetical protein
MTKEDAFMTEAGALKAKNGPKSANSTAFDQNQRFSAISPHADAISECSGAISKRSIAAIEGS